jgi:hypothetical protein
MPEVKVSHVWRWVISQAIAAVDGEYTGEYSM